MPKRMIGAPAQTLVAVPASGDGPVLANPLQNPEWDSLLSTQPASSFFHGRSWAQVLHETYGHRPAYFCRIQAAALEQLLPVMEVSSWWLGRRGVSLPFTDLCSPLESGHCPTSQLYRAALDHGASRNWRYLECRSAGQDWPDAKPSLKFYGHIVELSCGLDALFARFDGAVRRAIRKAQRASVRVEFSTEMESMRAYYALHCRTRRRHGLPPQPWQFFENIARFVLSQNQGFLALAQCAEQVVAGAVFFQHAQESIYKFGASDFRWQHLRPNNLVMWESIQRLAASGHTGLHLGRTSLFNEGLRRFKLGFGAREEEITYCKYDFGQRAFVTDCDRASGWFNRLFAWMPLPLLRLAGRMLYPHLS